MRKIICLLIVIGLSGATLPASARSSGLTSAPALRQTKQGRKDTRKSAKKASPEVEPLAPASPRHTLDQALAAPSQRERIEKLEAFLASQPEAALDKEARDRLIREYALRGEQSLREGSPQLALQDFKALFKAMPGEITERVFSQFIFPLPIAMNAFGYRSESVDLMRHFEPRFEGDLNRMVQIGFFYVQIEAPLEAVRVLEKAVQLGPQDHRAHNSLGTAYLISLRLDDAAVEFEKALSLNPRDEYANLNLANVARAAGDHERAMTYYRKQIELKPEDAEAHGGLAISLIALGRDEEAEREIKRAQSLAPEDYRFLTQLAYFYTTRKKAALARPLVERAAQIDPRYTWAHIAKANIDLAEMRYGDALSTILHAQTLGSFPTLSFEAVKMLMALDGYDQAIDVLNQAFKITEAGEYEAMLGGVVKARSPRLDLLLERERQAALMLHEHPTTSLQYRLAEALGRIDRFSKMVESSRKSAESGPGRRRAGQGQRAQSTQSKVDEDLKTASRPRRAGGADVTASVELSAGKDASLPGASELIKALTDFTSLDDGRQPFRMVWAARRLTDAGIVLDAAEQLARRAIALADAATEPEGSMRDTPLLNREGRRAVFLGRAFDALGWNLFKRGRIREAVDNLTKAVEFYPPSPERNNAIWHLAVAVEESGDQKRALDLYIASYERDTPTSSVRRSRIESLYKKLNGSLAGLNQKLGEK
ncbi:MAG TPA: tetratricopeptide repeat protein [Blastocatellia bacterium]|nr:tetratricopeptide repeat protein [Blastocatellia bacterium]